jgi:sirohydrochlorin cobaltochelatase
MTAIVLFAHGSRDPAWQRPMLAVAQRIRDQLPQAWVACAYLELTEPSLTQAVAQAVTLGHVQIRVLPMFLGVGKHVREDLPILMAQLQHDHPQVQFDLQPAVGEQSAVLDALALAATTDMPPPSAPGHPDEATP